MKKNEELTSEINSLVEGSSTTPTTAQQNNSNQVTCQVCYLAASNGLHFGARTCAACAAFFRRSISDQKRYICKRSQRCIIRPGEGFFYFQFCFASLNILVFSVLLLFGDFFDIHFSYLIVLVVLIKFN